MFFATRWFLCPLAVLIFTFYLIKIDSQHIVVLWINCKWLLIGWSICSYHSPKWSKLVVDLLLHHQHMETAYPGSNILVVTLTNGESKRVEAQSDRETLKEAMEVLRNMFGPGIPEATDILVPRWWNNRFQRGSYSNYPIYFNHQIVDSIKVNILYYTLILHRLNYHY